LFLWFVAGNEAITGTREYKPNSLRKLLRTSL
jgi:hypothetical protein